jgi:hypothetical protein
MTFFRSAEGKTSMDSIQNKILTEEIGIQNLLTELEQKLSQQFSHIKTIKDTEKGNRIKI